ncbi:MAG: hypothetical protein MJY41_04335 [Bacteroidales bacterium]|nr:hypothetical protein [Bacteroidales bacterium]
MKRIITIVAFAALAIVCASCSKSRAEQMALAENVKVECTPEVLTAIAGNIPVSITVTCPEGYFHPKATMEVVPVLVFNGGEVAGPTFKYQGDKVKDNNKVISKNGGSVSEKFNFAFQEGMEASHLELRSKAFYKNDVIDIPAIKVADGVNVTYQLVDLTGAYSLKDDGYQNVIHTSTEGQILYDVNSASVKNSELRNASVNELKQTLKETKANERAKVTGTKIIAYASPEGGQNYNAKLSDKRAGTAEKAWATISKGMEASSTEIQSVGQDWEGFQQAVSASNIEDKDLILRVLSMYSDPAVRENEIRNMSQIFTEMNKKVFPSLRRARFITEVEYQNYSDDELKALAKERLEEIGEDGLLRLATLSEDRDEQEVLYEMAAEKFNSQKAIYNLAAIALDKGFAKEANKWLAQVDGVDSDAINAQGVLALRDGKYDKAVELFRKAGTNEAKQNEAAVEILRGNYDAAAAKLAGATGNNAALANILAGNYDAAEEALVGEDAMTDYLRAIVAARKGNVSDVKVYLNMAAQKNPELGVKAAKDIEFANFR